MGEIDFEKLTERQVQDIVDWLLANYEEIVEACVEKRLPKPPPV